MKEYLHLDLGKIREEANLSFALVVPLKQYKYSQTDNETKMPYIIIKANDELYIKDQTAIVHGNLTTEQMNIVCSLLQKQLGDDYVVQKPETDNVCIVIRLASKISSK